MTINVVDLYLPVDSSAARIPFPGAAIARALFISSSAKDVIDIVSNFVKMILAGSSLWVGSRELSACVKLTYMKSVSMLLFLNSKEVNLNKYALKHIYIKTQIFLYVVH